MKFLLVLLLLCYCTSADAQKITIKGTAFDSTHGRNWVKIIRNDTIRKFFADSKNKYETYTKLASDTNYVVLARQDGKFSIEVEKMDSLIFEGHYHLTKRIAVSDLLQQNKIEIILEPEVCKTYIPCTDSLKHFVFIGKKIAVNYAHPTYYCNMYIMDSKYEAVYTIEETIYGKFSGDTIRFIIYDHYGTPAFSKYETTMLLVTDYCNEWVHMKYQFFDVYLTKDNRWAAPYSAADYARLGDLSTIKPERIDFMTPVEINVLGMSKEWIEKTYPTPYYSIKNGKAIAHYGNYTPELLEIKKQTVLKARGIIL